MERFRRAWWSILRDGVFPLAGLFGLYQLFTGHFTEWGVPVVGGICMALLGLPFWDREDERRRAESVPDEDAESNGKSDRIQADNGSDFSIRIGLPGRRRRPRGRGG